jgi:hypothetical protein
MSKTPRLDDHIDEYWAEVSDLTIFEAAFWMKVGGDPRSHRDRCAQDDAYDYAFHDHPGGAEAVHQKCLVILSAIRGEHIQVITEVRRSDQELDLHQTLIRKSDWIAWCRRNGYSELADRFEGESGLAAPLGVDENVTGVSSGENEVDTNESGGDDPEDAPSALADREPYIQSGRNTRAEVIAWVVWQAKALVDATDTTETLAAKIIHLAEAHQYQSERRPLTESSIIRMIPSGLTGGRGKKRASNFGPMDFRRQQN